MIFLIFALQIIITNRIMKIDHFAMYVKDLEAARSFFMRYFGASSKHLPMKCIIILKQDYALISFHSKAVQDWKSCRVLM